jgi:hypothetical protein
LAGADDGLVTVAPVLERVDSFAARVEGDAESQAFAAIRAAETTGRPLARRAPGRKPTQQTPETPWLS